MNKDLYNNQYEIPNDVLNYIQSSINKYKPKEGQSGFEKAQNHLNKKTITYQNLKRVKNYFDNLKDGYDKIEFDLNGGDLMKDYVNSILTSERQKVKSDKKIKSDYAQMDNQFRKTHDKDSVKISTDVSEGLSIGKLFEEIINDRMNELKKVSIAIIVDNNDKYFLAQREPNDDWMGGKWAFVGGTSEPNELPEQTLYRELKEEIGVTPKSYEKKFVINNRETNTIETFFLVKLNEGYIKLDFEHTNFGWFTIQEIHKLDTVPDVLNCILKTK
jgi:mutator protein MutT